MSFLAQLEDGPNAGHFLVEKTKQGWVGCMDFQGKTMMLLLFFFFLNE